MQFSVSITSSAAKAPTRWDYVRSFRNTSLKIYLLRSSYTYQLMLLLGRLFKENRSFSKDGGGFKNKKPRF